MYRKFPIYTKVTNRIDTIAKLIPIQFFFEMDSLNKNRPTSVETITMATLLTVNKVELSKPSNCNAFKRKKIE